MYICKRIGAIALPITLTRVVEIHWPETASVACSARSDELAIVADRSSEVTITSGSYVMNGAGYHVRKCLRKTSFPASADIIRRFHTAVRSKRRNTSAWSAERGCKADMPYAPADSTRTLSPQLLPA